MSLRARTGKFADAATGGFQQVLVTEYAPGASIGGIWTLRIRGRGGRIADVTLRFSAPAKIE